MAYVRIDLDRIGELHRQGAVRKLVTEEQRRANRERSLAARRKYLAQGNAWGYRTLDLMQKREAKRRQRRAQRRHKRKMR